MSSIFRPVVRRAINQAAADSSHGIFGGDLIVLKKIEEKKKMNTLIKSVLLQTIKSGKADISLTEREDISLQPGGPRPRARKTLKRRPLKREPRQTLMN